MNFDYLKYRFKAKGRHGTHSPFVYAFVEQVLRKPKSNFLFKSKTKQQIILIQLIAFLKVEYLYYLSNSLFIDKQNIQKEFPHLQIYEVESLDGLSTFQKSLIILDITDLNKENRRILKEIKQKKNFSLWINHIHKNIENQQVWNQTKAFDNFPLSLDCWTAGFLIQDESFIIKQHFLVN